MEQITELIQSIVPKYRITGGGANSTILHLFSDGVLFGGGFIKLASNSTD
jgi:hypothetical protein